MAFSSRSRPRFRSQRLRPSPAPNTQIVAPFDVTDDSRWIEGGAPRTEDVRLEVKGRSLYVSPGARKEKLREREFQPRLRRSAAASYCELHAASSFSFLRGSSQPEDLIERAAELEIPAIALLDRGGLYGAPRFYKAAKQAGIKALVGAEVVLEQAEWLGLKNNEGPGQAPGAEVVRPADQLSGTEIRLPVLVASPRGYRNLSRMLTAGALARPKGEAAVNLATLTGHADDLHCLVGGGSDPVSLALKQHGFEAARRVLERVVHCFGGPRAGRVHVELQRHFLRSEEVRNRMLVELANRLRLPLIATGGARCARDRDEGLLDVMTCIRHHTHLDAAGSLLDESRQRHLLSAAQMQSRFVDCPRALAHAGELAAQLDFTLENLGYRFPEYPVPADETPMSYLRKLVWNAAPTRFRPLTAKAQAQLEKELNMIDKLDLAGYFLIVWDIVRFCLENKILAQGRGSAANSAVCFALRITAVDPVKMDLLFERFLSEERGEWPDIDLDLPSGDQRERVIQYVYQRYGRYGAAMTANVITYRDRLSAREVGKALGYSAEQVDRLAKRLGSWNYDTSRGDQKELNAEVLEIGFDPQERRMRLFLEMWRRLQNHPRHLGQHSGGMVMAAGRLDEVVPLEPAAMEGRVIVQWDKDDCADLGIIKVDLLGLGMLNALEEAVPLIRVHQGVHLDLAHLPQEDPETYEMIRRADTVGTFQIESRAQMASLPRNGPRNFYDLVIQVAIIRPGPIVGKITHPYFERRVGRQEVTYPDPRLRPILEKTLGVPVFQEQILKLAMEAAGFSGGEAEELRRAMGFKRSMERMQKIEQRLVEGMTERGINEEGQKQILKAITSFALYGFPESHAASFALIAYASAYLKRHHPAAFFLSLLNAWPMGFYHPATLVKEAQRAGVVVAPICVNTSAWRCLWHEPVKEVSSPGRGSKPPLGPIRNGGIRIGLRYVKGLRREIGERIVAEQTERRFVSVEDVVRRCRLRSQDAALLAEAGALAALGSGADGLVAQGLGARGSRARPGANGARGSNSAHRGLVITRREALWQVARAARPAGELFERHEERGAPSPLPEMTPLEETFADFRLTELTTGRHPMEYFRAQLKRRGILSAAEVVNAPSGRIVRTAGSVIVRQRPGTARGLLFLTLEDETGMCQAIVMPDLLREYREVIRGSAGLIVEGLLQRRDGSVSVKANRVWPIDQASRVPSHDFH